MKINLIIERLFIVFKVDSHAALARALGVSATTLSNWKKRETIDYDLIFTKCEDINLNWLLLGKGPMALGIGDPIYKDIKEPYEPKDYIIRSQFETINIQKRYIDLLENDLRRLRKIESNEEPGEPGQKRKAG